LRNGLGGALTSSQKKKVGLKESKRKSLVCEEKWGREIYTGWEKKNESVLNLPGTRYTRARLCKNGWGERRKKRGTKNQLPYNLFKDPVYWDTLLGWG